jgi:hypothetical protein
MARKRSLLEQMLANPAKGWTIADVTRLCAQTGLEIRPPSHGSHYVVFSDALDGILTVPAHRPIKPVYIRKLAALAPAHAETKDRP